MSAVSNAINEDLSDERADAQRMLEDAVTTFVARATSPKRIRALRDTEPGFDRNLWSSIAEQGWLGVLVPESYGGMGLGFAEMRIVAEGLGGALIPEPVTACAVLATRALLHGDNDALKQRLLPKMVAGETMLALAWQEGNAGTNPKAELRATRTAQGIVLNGSKRFVTPAVGVDGFIVSADGEAGTVLYYLPADAAGLERQLHRLADGTSGGTLSFKATPVAADAIVASGKVADAALRRAIDEATVVASIELLGVMSRALDMTLNYMKTRVQFDKPIGSFQALQHRAVDLWIQQQLATALVSHVVSELDRDPGADRLAELASRCKSRCSDAGLDLTRDCIRLHGAIGFTDDCDIGLHLQRALVLAAWLGNGAEHRRRFDASRATHADADADSAAALKRIKAADLPGEPGERPRDSDWNALSDEEFRFEAAAFLERHYPQQLRFAQRRPRKSDLLEYMKTLSRYGWLAPAWPRKWGGMELSPAKQVILYEERERYGAMRVLEQGITHIGPLLMQFGTDAQRAFYLPKILAVEQIWCQGYSEPNAGSDLASLKTVAVKDGDEYVINGSKIWTSQATEADHIYVLARTDKDAKRQSGISFFLLDLKTPGITLRPIRVLTGEEPFCQTFFDNVRVPAENMVGGLNQGWAVAKGLLGFERLSSGDPRRPRYPLTKSREIARECGLWEDAEFRSKFTKLEMDLYDLSVIFQEYADVVSSGAAPGPGISMLKIWSSETTMRLCALMLEAAGSAASQRGEIDFGEARADVLGSFYTLFPATIAAGTNDIQRNVLAKRALGLPG